MVPTMQGEGDAFTPTTVEESSFQSPWGYKNRTRATCKGIDSFWDLDHSEEKTTLTTKSDNPQDVGCYAPGWPEPV